MKKTFLIITALLLITTVHAGESQFGLVNNSLGNIKVPYSASAMARSFSMAHLDSTQINNMNFAASTDLSRTLFSLNIGYNAFNIENKNSSTFYDDANFIGSFLAVPLQQKKIVLFAGLQPYTGIEQIVVNSTEFDQNEINQNLYITGGLSRANLNVAYRFSDYFSAALGYEYTFGKITENVVINIDDDLSSRLKIDYDNKVYANGAVLSLFANPVNNLNVGFVYRVPVIGKMTKTGSTPSDALNTDQEYDIRMPAEINMGMQYKIAENNSVGIDFMYQDWKKGYLLNDDKLADHNTYYHIGAGYEKTGSKRRFVKYSELIDYRAGIYYKQLAHLYNGKAVNEIGLTAGLSLPIQRFRSKIDLVGFLAKRGSLSTNQLEELVIGFGISISASETWFVNIED